MSSCCYVFLPFKIVEAKCFEFGKTRVKTLKKVSKSLKLVSVIFKTYMNKYRSTEVVNFIVIVFPFPGLAQFLLRTPDVLDPGLHHRLPAVVPVPLPAEIDRAHHHDGTDHHVTETDEAVTERGSSVSLLLLCTV